MMKTFINLLRACIFLSYSKYCASDNPLSILTTVSKRTLSEDGKLNFTELASKYGHPAEEHEVVTEDGYILTVFHLPGEKPPVLLFHGLGDCSDTFIIRGEASLAISLAAEGYDVWVGNNRGNKYGRRHLRLNPDKDDQFWDYSFHEIGCYDLAATIDLVRNKTGRDSIATVSHSQGTSAHYALASTKPEYNNRINLAITMAPIVYFDHVKPPTSLLLQAGPVIATLAKWLGIHTVYDGTNAKDDVKVEPNRIEPEFIDTIYGHHPSPTSSKSLVHFDQIALSKRFRQYDYGKKANLDKYGAENPPDYDFKAMTMNYALLVGNNDDISRVKDVEHLKDCLPNVVHYEVMEPELWTHADFIWASDMPKYLFPSIFKLLEDYN